MDRLAEIKLLVKHWEHKREMTDAEYLADYKVLLKEINRLQMIVNAVSFAVSGDCKDIESNESAQAKPEAE